MVKLDFECRVLVCDQSSLRLLSVAGQESKDLNEAHQPVFSEIACEAQACTYHKYAFEDDI